jgi:hypothetical protein
MVDVSARNPLHLISYTSSGQSMCVGSQYLEKNYDKNGEIKNLSFSQNASIK